jgi:hypothetical protein
MCSSAAICASNCGSIGAICDGIACYLDGAYLQRLRIDAQMDLAPFTSVLGAMLLALALAFASGPSAKPCHLKLFSFFNNL